jgi:hypothetical protein
MFHFTKEQNRKFVEWLAAHDKVCPYVHHHGDGGNDHHMTYSFTPSDDEKRVHATVKCGCGGHIDLGTDWAGFPTFARPTVPPGLE